MPPLGGHWDPEGHDRAVAMRTAPVDTEPSSDNSSLHEEMVLADYTERPLRLLSRPRMTVSQKVFTGLFYLQLAFQLLLGVGLWQARNRVPADTDGACSAGFRRERGGMCIEAALYDRREACKATVPDTVRRLEEEEEGKKSNKAWDMLERNPRLPAVTVGISALLCVLALFSLTFAAGCVTWGMFAINAVLMLYGFYLTHNWMLLVALAVIVALTIWGRDDIMAAISCMKVGAQALKDTPVVFALNAGVQLVWFLYALVFMWFTTFNMERSFEVGPDCGLVPSTWFSFYLKIVPFLFVLTTFFFRHVTMAVVSLAVGAWCFPQEARLQGSSPSGAAILGLELALTKSCGSVFAASFILSLVDTLRKKTSSDNMLWWADPMACFFRLIWCCLETTVGALTRFALIGHMFQGDGLCFVAGLTGDMLARRLPGVLMCGFVSERVTRQMSMMGSTAIGFGIWWYLDHVEGLGFWNSVKNFVTDNNDQAEDPVVGWGQTIALGLTLVMLWCVRNPVLAILLGVWFLCFEWNNGWFSCFTISVVLASFVSVIFNYFTSTLEYATDTAFYCMALEAEGSKRSIRLQPLHEVSQKHAKKMEEDELEDNENNDVP